MTEGLVAVDAEGKIVLWNAGLLSFSAWKRRRLPLTHGLNITAFS